MKHRYFPPEKYKEKIKPVTSSLHLTQVWFQNTGTLATAPRRNV